MIHEVMVLDHSGPDFAMILYGASLKMWIIGALLSGLLIPVRTGNPWLDAAAAVLASFPAGRADRHCRISHGQAAAAPRTATARERRVSLHACPRADTLELT